MPPNAKVVIFEDKLDWQERIAEWITDEGHTVIATASTRQGALDGIPDALEKGATVFTIDGDLSPKSWDGRDGAEVVHAINQAAAERGLKGNVFTVGMGLKPVYGVTVHVGKERVEFLGGVITELPQIMELPQEEES